MRKWTLVKCLKDARKHKSKEKWRKKDPGSYKAALRNGWSVQCCKNMPLPQPVWTKEKCIKSAKRFKTRSEWKRTDTPAYNNARKQKWLEECFFHMLAPNEANRKYSLDVCLSEAKKYNNKQQWYKNDEGSYYAALRNGWLNECSQHMLANYQCQVKWTKERCIETAKGFKNRAAWKKEYVSAYSVARKNNWLEECCLHMLKSMEIKRIYTFKICKITAKKYKTRNEWNKKSSGSYQAACKNKWMDSCCSHMLKTSDVLSKAILYWTKAKCLKSAKKFRTLTKWVKTEGGAYWSAKLNGWFQECTRHMPDCATGELREIKNAHPVYKKLFKKLGITFKHEERIGDGRIDFTIETMAGLIGIEVKHDKSSWTPKLIKTQLDKYSKWAETGDLPLIGIILSSPKGKYGSSIKELEFYLINNKIKSLFYKV